MRRLIIILGVFVLLLAAVNFTAFAETETTNSTATTTNTTTTTTTTPATPAAPSGTDISAGVPTVTSDTFVGKINSMTNEIYKTARGVIPGVTVVALILGVGAMILFWDYKARIGMILCGLILVMWAPQLVGFVIGIAQF